MGIVYIQSEGEPELPSLFRPEMGEGLYFSPISFNPDVNNSLTSGA